MRKEGCALAPLLLWIYGLIMSRPWNTHGDGRVRLHSASAQTDCCSIYELITNLKSIHKKTASVVRKELRETSELMSSEKRRETETRVARRLKLRTEKYTPIFIFVEWAGLKYEDLPHILHIAEKYSVKQKNILLNDSVSRSVIIWAIFSRRNIPHMKRLIILHRDSTCYQAPPLDRPCC